MAGVTSRKKTTLLDGKLIPVLDKCIYLKAELVIKELQDFHCLPFISILPRIFFPINSSRIITLNTHLTPLNTEFKSVYRIFGFRNFSLLEYISWLQTITSNLM